MYPYQKALLKMIETLPEGAVIKSMRVSRDRNKTYAVKDGKIYLFEKGKWVCGNQ